MTPSSDALAALADDALIAEIERRRPDLVVAPREASLIMALRAAQAEGVFAFGEDLDSVECYIDLREVPQSVHGYTCDRYVGDERLWLVAAAIWRGCIAGLEEWRARRTREGDTAFIRGWLKPCVPRTPAPTLTE